MKVKVQRAEPTFVVTMSNEERMVIQAVIMEAKLRREALLQRVSVARNEAVEVQGHLSVMDSIHKTLCISEDAGVRNEYFCHPTSK